MEKRIKYLFEIFRLILVNVFFFKSIFSRPHFVFFFEEFMKFDGSRKKVCNMFQISCLCLVSVHKTLQSWRLLFSKICSNLKLNYMLKNNKHRKYSHHKSNMPF